jgi:glutathione synthase/RimK-type ligase-like ATP-grasp enzyme
MKCLVVTEPDDTHAILTKLALETMGHQVRFLFIADQPTKQINSVFIDNTSYRWKSSEENAFVVDHEYEVVWWRRVRKPYIPKAVTHPADYKFVVRENILFYEGVTYNLAPNAWWINTKEAAGRANAKLLQLNIARQCGLIIPTTLCSNDPKEIRRFVMMYYASGVIYKPFFSNFWFEDQQIKIAYTSKVTFADLPENDQLQLVPGIYQKEIKKKYELRVTCFGDYLVAAKLNSQSHPEGKVDWRAIPENEMTVEPYRLPHELQKQIRTFMNTLGIVFGSLDFIVTPEGQYVLLEVNEQGQFMWIEEYNPEFKMLDMFVSFILNKSKKFNWDPKKAKHTIEHYREAMGQMMAANMGNHVDLNSAKAHNE